MEDAFGVLWLVYHTVSETATEFGLRPASQSVPLQTAHPFLAITEQTERAHTNVQVLLNPLMCLNGYHHFVKFI